MTSKQQPPLKTLTAARLQCEEDKPIRVIVSNDTVTSHGYRLVHSADAVDLSKSKRGVPLLVSHDQNQLPVGRVKQLQLEDNQLTGVLTFGAKGADIEADMRAGVITDVSVGAEYSPRDTEDDDGVTVINSWRPVEVSAVSIGAIEGANVQNRKPKLAEVVSMESTERLEAIKSVFAPFSGAVYDSMRLKAIDEGWSAEKAQQHLLNHFARQDKKEVESIPEAGHVQPGVDERDKFLAGADVALRYRAGLYSHDDDGRKQQREDAAALVNNELAGMSLMDLARESLIRCGINTRGMNTKQIADMALKGTPQTYRFTAAAGYTSSDFASLISTSANKQLAAGYDESDESWRLWTSTVSMSNFQQHQFPVLSSFGDLASRPEGGAYGHGSFEDKHELATLVEYGRRFAVDRQTLINDDLGALSRIPRLMGRAAARNVGDLVYAVLTTGTSTAMNEDSTNLFDVSTHGNYVTSGAAPSVTTLNAALTAMATQTDPNGATIGIRPRYLIVPVNLEASARALLASENDPAITPETSNPFQGAFQLVSDYRLDAFNSSGWFMSAAPGVQVETVAVGFLNGQQSPTLQEETSTERPGIIYTVTHDCVAAALDWRGLYYNDGVT